MAVLFDAKKLQLERKRRELTQAMLAERAETSEQRVRSLESNEKRNPSAVMVLHLNRALQITTEDLIMVKQENLK